MCYHFSSSKLLNHQVRKDNFCLCLTTIFQTAIFLVDQISFPFNIFIYSKPVCSSVRSFLTNLQKNTFYPTNYLTIFLFSPLPSCVCFPFKEHLSVSIKSLNNFLPGSIKMSDIIIAPMN
jgi:hypothetical protein